MLKRFNSDNPDDFVVKEEKTLDLQRNPNLAQSSSTGQVLSQTCHKARLCHGFGCWAGARQLCWSSAGLALPAQGHVPQAGRRHNAVVPWAETGHGH